MIYQIQEHSTLQLGQINGIVMKENSDNKFLYIQQIIYYTDLPRNLRSYERQSKSRKGMVWLTEKRELVNTNSIIDHVDIWLEDLPEPSKYDYQINEILYLHNNRPKLRPITQRHKLLYYNKPTPLSGVHHLKFFVDLYHVINN